MMLRVSEKLAALKLKEACPQPFWSSPIVGFKGVPQACLQMATASACDLYHLGGQILQNYDDMDQIERGVEMLQAALSLMKQTGDEKDASHAATIAAEGLIKLGRYDEARPLLEYAQPILETMASYPAMLKHCRQLLAKAKGDDS